MPESPNQGYTPLDNTAHRSEICPERYFRLEKNVCGWQELLVGPGEKEIIRGANNACANPAVTPAETGKRFAGVTAAMTETGYLTIIYVALRKLLK